MKSYLCAALVVFSVEAVRPGIRKEHQNLVGSAESHLDLPRFSQARSKFNLFVFLANLFYPGQNPSKYKETFQTGGCPSWFLDYTTTNQQIANEWISRPGWTYRHQESVISYEGNSDGVENPHPFPFFWLTRRPSLKNALIKRNFFCQNSQLQSDVMLRGAKEAGILFRVIGERNFWAVIAKEGEHMKLIRVKEGEPQVKLQLPGVKVEQNKYYTINVQEWLGDVLLTVSEEGAAKPVSARYDMKSDEEVSPAHYEDDQGAVGLIANHGPAIFRNTFLADVNWSPNTGGPGKLSEKMNEFSEKDREQAMARDSDIMKELPDDLKGWCPEGALCAGEPYS